MRRRIAAMSLAIALGMAPASAAPPDPNARYKELVAAYASGDRAVAVAGIGSLDEDALRSGVESVREYPPRLLLAVLMLHTDRRLLERGMRDAPETLPACESPQTDPAWRTAQHLMLHVDGIEPARRWSIAITLRDQWDGCFDDARHWIDAGARWFPRDAEVLLVRGTLYETVATLPTRLPRPIQGSGTQARQRHLAAATRTQRLDEARRSLEQAVAAAPADDRARLRLGRVLWRLGKGEAARTALESVIARSREDTTLFLAHMFVGRIHRAAGRHAAALREYRAALALQPTSQGAAIALADAIQLAGDPDSAPAAVEAALAMAGRREPPQSLWEYAFGNARRANELLERLREDVGP